SGTAVEFGVLRVAQTEAKKVSVVRATIVYPDVTGRMDGQTGVIQVQGLMPGRVKEVAAQIAALEKQGAKKLVLDLRHCSTGPDEEGIALANLFQESGLITYTLGQKSARQDFTAQSSKAVTKYYSPDGKSIQDNGVTPNILQAEADVAVADGAADDSLPDVAPDDTKKP